MITKHIPNFITILNLMCGVFAVMIAISGISPITEIPPYTLAAVLIFAGAVFDFFDGFAARILKANSPIGKELDSLADLITFGFAPAAIVSAIVQHILFGSMYGEYEGIAVWQEYVMIFTPFIIVPFSALRLAKFNVDERQTHSFIGLPTPANAIFFGSLIFFPDLSPLLITFLCIAFSLLLVSEIPMFSLKFKTFGLQDNVFKYSFIAASAIAFIIFGYVSIPFIILSYIISSIIIFLLHKKN